MKRRNFIVICLALIALSLGLTGFAQNSKPEGGRGGMHGHHNPMEFMFKELNLTSEQQAKVQAIHAAQRSAIKTILDSNFASHEKLHDLLKSGSFDLAQVRAIAQSQANAQLALLIEKQRTDSQIYAILDTDQQARFDELQSRFSQRRPMPPNEDRMVDMLSHRLALTSDQQTLLTGVLAKQKETIVPMLEKLASFHEQLATITARGHFDEEQINALAQQYLPVMVDLTVAHTTTHFNIASLLTAEQKQDFLRFPPMGGPGGFPGGPGGPGGRFPDGPPRGGFTDSPRKF